MAHPSIYNSAFRNVPKTGVIYVTEQAGQHGFSLATATNWSNMGQGMPECGPLIYSPNRINSILLEDMVHEYAPVAGILDLRAAIADMYNRRFRQGMKSKYTAENVAVSAGGRTALTRIAASLGSINLGHFLPDYTAYEELLDIFRFFNPIPIIRDPEKNYLYSTDELKKEIMGKGLAALLFSNPCNPTGQVVAEDELCKWLSIGQELECAFIIDEFYSHYIWNNQGSIVTAAKYITDVNKDQVIIIDGLTKNWRYAGWRIAWTLGPKSIIEAISSAGSFLDGGAPHPLQRAAIPLLEDHNIEAETKAIQTIFGKKRKFLIQQCRAMGMVVANEPQGGFYVFADLSKLPKEIATGIDFFQAALKKQVICVPGMFFDINPGKRRPINFSRFNNYIRLSFGPCYDAIKAGCDRLHHMINSFAS